MYDKSAIKNAADILTVANHIGIPVRTVGKRPQILCPCHDDEHFGSCFVNPVKKTFHCYACGADGDVFYMVQAKLNVSFNDALTIVADTCGGAERFAVKRPDRPLPKKGEFIPYLDQQFLGICNNSVYRETAYYETEEAYDAVYGADAHMNARRQYSEDGYVDGYIATSYETSSPLYELYASDEYAYRNLVDDFCRRKISQYQNVLALFRQREIADDDLRGVVKTIRSSRITQSEIESQIAEQIARARRISLKYGNGKAISVLRGTGNSNIRKEHSYTAHPA